MGNDDSNVSPLAGVGFEGKELNTDGWVTLANGHAAQSSGRGSALAADQRFNTEMYEGWGNSYNRVSICLGDPHQPSRDVYRTSPGGVATAPSSPRTMGGDPFRKGTDASPYGASFNSAPPTPKGQGRFQEEPQFDPSEPLPSSVLLFTKQNPYRGAESESKENGVLPALHKSTIFFEKIQGGEGHDAGASANSRGTNPCVQSLRGVVETRSGWMPCVTACAARLCGGRSSP